MDRSSPDVLASSTPLAASNIPKSNPQIAYLVPPIAIGVAGNEEFLDRVAALFVRQVLAARETGREQNDDLSQRPKPTEEESTDEPRKLRAAANETRGDDNSC